MVRGGVDNFVEARGLEAALRPQVGPGRSPGGGPGGEAPGSSWVFVYFRVKPGTIIVHIFQFFLLKVAYRFGCLNDNIVLNVSQFSLYCNTCHHNKRFTYLVLTNSGIG